jgi:N-acetylglutamate synthase-like GNAT family acetyltransferase
MRWINEAPVREVSAQEFARLANVFIEDLEGNWMVDKKVVKALETEDDRKRAKKWNRRVESSIAEADVYGQDGRKFAYLVDGKAVALMRVRQEADSLKVEDLSAHPGSQGAGEIMIEKAVNVSEECGKRGLVTLFAAGDSGGFYEKLGFESIDNAKLRLRPSGAKEWVRLSDGKWRLKKYPSEMPFVDGVFDTSGNVDGKA